jgi:predicted kinase
MRRTFSMSKLIIMSGIPGSGKTTLAKRLCEEYGSVRVSRDDIRMSILKDSMRYFDVEKSVYKRFISEIRKNLDDGKTVIADATHNTVKSIGKVFNEFYDCGFIGIIYMDTPLDTCLARNASRTGRFKVSESAIRRFHEARCSKSDLTSYADDIWVVKEGDRIPNMVKNWF